MTHLVLEGLTMRYGATTVLDGIDISVEQGQLICLLGPSGCGKTTTLRLIAGFATPTAGRVKVGGRVLSEPGAALPPERRRMSMIFQSYALWPHMTVGENVAYGLKLKKLPRPRIRKMVADILETTKLAPLVDRYPGELSGGQQQRVSLARALVVEPETLLLDEPLSNLDANLREEMRFEVRRLHDAYRYTTVYVTHDQIEAMTTADLVAVMNGGHIEQLGSPREVYDRPVSEFVARFLGGSNILKGTARDAAHIEIAGQVIKGTGPALASGATAAMSVRQHEIAFLTTGAAVGDPGQNRLHGTVVRNIFLGPSRDYVVALADETQIRVTAPPDIDMAPGTEATLHLPEMRCRLLTH